MRAILRIIKVSLLSIITVVAFGSTVSAATQTQTFLLHGEQGEVSGTGNGSVVTPNVGIQGTVVVKGSGSVNFAQAQVSNGISFGAGGQQNTNTAFYKFEGSSVGNIFNSSGGEINFYVKSNYTFAERLLLPSRNYRYVFEVYDASKVQFNFASFTDGSNLIFSYTIGGVSGYYYVSKGKEDSTFGKGTLVKVRMSWNGTSQTLYVNDIAVATKAYTPVTTNWSSASVFTLGSASNYGGGYFSSDDLIDEFQVSSGSGSVAAPAGPTVKTITEVPRNISVPSTPTRIDKIPVLPKGTPPNTPIVPVLNTTPVVVKPVIATTTPVNTTIIKKLTPTGNGIVITERLGQAETNYPVRIGRPFVKGEISNYPQAMIDGQLLLTQADIKNRWSDGSVKFAILSFVVPSLPANASIPVVFKNQASGNNTPLSKAQMLSADFNFDATISLTKNGVTKVASARSMLANGDYTYWASGPVATTILLRDTSATRKYDLGFDSYKPFRPMFEATFWPATNQVKVRYIGELTNTEELEDVVINNLVLTSGYTNPQTAYTLPTAKSPLTMTAASVWTKEYWIGGTPHKEIDLDNNLPYLSSTYFIPNYDTSKVVTESDIHAQYTVNYNSWAKVKKDLYDPGFWQPAMGTAGGSQYRGPNTEWTTKWLYTGDWRMREISLTNTNLAGAWQWQFREGNSSKYLDRSETVPGIGRIMSVSSRPSIFMYQGLKVAATAGNAQDRPKLVGAITNGGWEPNGSHQPNVFSVAYILTGDYWYLEEMQLVAAWSAARYNWNAPYGRGPTGKEGGISDQVRGDGWVIANRAEAAFLSPDNTPEKAYFTTLTNDAIAIWEGVRNITNTPNYNSTLWKWGNTVSAPDRNKDLSFTPPKNIGVPVLHNWEGVNTGLKQEPVDGTKVSSATSQWMEVILIYGLGRARELGFASGPLLTWVGSHFTQQFTDSAFNPYLAFAYRTPTSRASDGAWFTNWADVKAAFNSSYDPVADFNNSLFDSDSYPFLSTPAAAMLANETGGTVTWNWFKANILNHSKFTNPKWAIVPRSSNKNSAEAIVVSSAVSLPKTVSTLTSQLTTKSVATSPTVTPVTKSTRAPKNVTVPSTVTTQNSSSTHVVDTKIKSTSFSSVPMFGQTSRDVTLLQSLLKKNGWYAGVVTGYFGEKTKASVIKFQTAQGFAGTGIVDAKTQALLSK